MIEGEECHEGASSKILSPSQIVYGSSFERKGIPPSMSLQSLITPFSVTRYEQIFCIFSITKMAGTCEAQGPNITPCLLGFHVLDMAWNLRPGHLQDCLFATDLSNRRN